MQQTMGRPMSKACLPAKPPYIAVSGDGGGRTHITRATITEDTKAIIFL